MIRGGHSAAVQGYADFFLHRPPPCSGFMSSALCITMSCIFHISQMCVCLFLPCMPLRFTWRQLHPDVRECSQTVSLVCHQLCLACCLLSMNHCFQWPMDLTPKQVAHVVHTLIIESSQFDKIKCSISVYTVCTIGAFKIRQLQSSTTMKPFKRYN